MTETENKQTKQGLSDRENQDTRSSTQTWIQWVRRFICIYLIEHGDWQWKKTLRWSIGLAVFIVIAAIMRQGIKHVREDQVGVYINNLTGTMRLIDRVGYHVYIPYLADFYVLEKTIQKMSLTWQRERGGSPRDIQLKTVDGSDVSLDVTINFKIIPRNALTVLQQSGLGARFADLWIESHTRHIALELFGELTTEELYDASRRNAKAEQCLERMNRLLQPQGIEVIAFIPGDFRFYREYEDVIREKKLADQQVEEQQAQARAFLQDQNRQIVEAVKQSEVKLREFEGECQNRLVQAQAEAQKIKRNADQYYQTTLLAANASLYSASAQAEGLRSKMLAEAEGMEKLRQAMSGQGGAGMIGLEYAKKLKETNLSGTPILWDSLIRQYSLQPAPAQPSAIPPFLSTQNYPSQGGTP